MGVIAYFIKVRNQYSDYTPHPLLNVCWYLCLPQTGKVDGEAGRAEG